MTPSDAIYRNEYSIELDAESKAPSFSTPILLITFNRPDTTQRVFNEIRKIKPQNLFIAFGCPRKDKPDDFEKCKETRKIISAIDWDCNLSTLIEKENKGCKIGVTSAINWFFSKVEEGIILEDDCVPDQTFFSFCKEMLAKYRTDERVMMIAGTNYLKNQNDSEDSYFFSKYYIIWGWATWRRAWNLYDISMKDWPELQKNLFLEWVYSDKRLINWYNILFQMAYENKIDAWDIQWWYSCIFQNGLCIVPKYNLISNIGVYGHFAGSNDGAYEEYLNMPTKPITGEKFIHPQYVVENPLYDRVILDRLFIDQPGWKAKILSKMNDILKFLSIKVVVIKRE